VIRDWFRNRFGKQRAAAANPAAAPSAPPPPAPREMRERTKRSLGLAQFVESVRDESGLSILDLGEISQPNVSFITGLGHRLFSVDFVRTLDSITVPEDPPGGPSQRNRIEAFIDQTLGYEPESIDGVFAWDALEHLNRPLLLAVVDRLYEILRPGAYLLAFFHAAEAGEWAPVYSYRIIGPDTLQLTFKTQRRPVERFNNRGIEKLFERYESVKFFLSRDHIREVIVRR